MKKIYFCFNHSDAEYTYLFDCPKEILEDKFDYVYPVNYIEPGKKSLISNNDESKECWISNVSDEELKSMIQKAFDKLIIVDDEYAYIDKCENGLEDLFDEVYDKKIESPKDLEDYLNDLIANSYLDCDSSSQFVWYKNENILNEKDLKEMYDED